MSTPSRPLLVAAFVALFGVATGAGYGVGRAVPAGEQRATPAGEELAPDSDAAATPPTASSATSAPPSTEVTTTTVPPPPLRVILAGDSVMAGLAPAVQAALAPAGAEVRFVLTPTIARDPTIRYTWQRQLDSFDPDLIVMFVGTWETGSVTAANGTGPGEAAWRASYESETLDPWLRLITSGGAQVLWIGNATVGSDAANELFAALNEAYRRLPERFPTVRFVDSDRALRGPQAGFSAVIPGPDGQPVRTRQTDLLHLCPDGAALLGALVVDEVAADFEIEVPDGWQAGPWRGDLVYPVDACPAP